MGMHVAKHCLCLFPSCRRSVSVLTQHLLWEGAWCALWPCAYAGRVCGVCGRRHMQIGFLGGVPWTEGLGCPIICSPVASTAGQCSGGALGRGTTNVLASPVAVGG